MDNNDPNMMEPYDNRIKIIPPTGTTIADVNSMCNKIKKDFLSLDNIDCKYQPRTMLCIAKCKHRERTWWVCRELCDDFKPYPGTEHWVEEFKKQMNK